MTRRPVVLLTSIMFALGMFAFGLLASACGSDDDGGGGGPGGGSGSISCSDGFTACGGDPTGTWDVVASCEVEIANPLDSCPEFSTTVTQDRTTGTVSLGSDESYSRTTNVDLDYVATFPVSCVAPLDCATAGSAASATCTTEGTSCRCEATLESTETVTGTWALDGNVIVVNDTDRNEFCAQGNDGSSRKEGETTWYVWRRR